jgi:beta-carotene/zeaxanthin 4-ketolase
MNRDRSLTSDHKVTISSRRQTVIGLSLIAAILVTWIAIHIYAMFFYRINATNWPLIPLIFAVQCWLSVGMFIAAHDGMHGSLAPGKKWVNEAVGSFLLAFYAGFGWRKMRNAHWDHHKYSGTAQDPDFDADNPAHFGRWYMTFLKRYFGLSSVLYVSSVVTTYWLLFDIPITNIVLLYGFPAIASSFQLFYFGTYRPHRHFAEQNPMVFADHHNARSNAFGPLASLLSCFHFGYHHEHHLSPQTPWWSLPKLHQSGITDNQKYASLEKNIL